MPVIRPVQRWPLGLDRAELVDLIAEELEGHSNPGGPVIFELDHEILVIWDRWDGVPHPERATIIREAYSTRPASDPAEPRIASVTAATVGEALENDLLPYQVSTNIPPGHPLREEVERAMLELGAIRANGRVELRAPTLEVARELYHKIGDRYAASPEVLFQMSRTVGSLND